jgi:hypothetical protein
MDESTETVRADIEATRARMSSTIEQLERKVDVVQKIKDNPWPALAIAFGVGLALSSAGADGTAANAAQKATTKVGSALDDILGTAVAGLTAAFRGRIDGAVHGMVQSIAGTDAGGRKAIEPPSRAD